MKHTNLLIILDKLKENADRFWKYVFKTDTCWWWKGATNERNYGRFRIGTQCFYSHRISAWLFGLIQSPIAPPKTQQHIRGFVLHTCDNPSCVNPSHFFIGNCHDNQIDAYAKKRRTSPFINKKFRYVVSRYGVINEKQLRLEF